MVFVVVGAVSRILNSSVVSPSSLILYSLVFIFLVAAIIHPSEFTCLFPSILYFLSLPSAFIFLNIYAIINLNNVSWGTRESRPQNINQTNSNGFFNNLFLRENNYQNENLNNLINYLERIEQKLNLNFNEKKIRRDHTSESDS